MLQRWKARTAGSAPWGVRPIGLLFFILAGLAAGLLAAQWGLLAALVTLAGLIAGVAAFFFPWAGLLVALAIAILLPFGNLPLRSGLTPSLLELPLLGCLAGWALPPLLQNNRRWHLSWPDALVWVLISLATFALLLGLGNGVDSNVLHNHFEFTLALAAFFAARQLARTPKRRRLFCTVLLLAAGLAALLGLALHALPDRTAQDLLVRLGPVGYPTTGRVLRYVEDDPNGLERAIGTSVDPNSFGGMLALVAAVTLGEILERWKGLRGRVSSPPPTGALPLPLLLLILAALLAGLYLTYSRAALGGLAVGALFLVVARYRRLWWAVLAAAVLLAGIILAMGPNHPVVVRFRQGLAFQDLANQMRLEEYAAAWAIVRRYPVLGVGFGSAPDADLTLGVSSMYLTAAERMGIAGLLALLGAIGAAFWQAWRFARDEEEAGRRIALLAGAVAALAIGMLDHYFFNPEFPHMAVLFWSTLGVASAARR